MTIFVGVSTKLYLSPSRTRAWVREVAAITAGHPAVRDGSVEVFVLPTAAVLESTIATFRGTGVRVGAQDLSAYPSGAFTGEIGAEFLAELGVTIAEIGHAERRRLFGDTDEVVARKIAAARAAEITPLLCVGEPERGTVEDAAAFCLAQLRVVPEGRLLIAYEPNWAIGAAQPAPAAYVRAVVRAIAAGLASDGRSAPILYGGAAGPGLLQALLPEVDGLFLGRRAHDPASFRAVLDEAAAAGTSSSN